MKAAPYATAMPNKIDFTVELVVEDVFLFLLPGRMPLTVDDIRLRFCVLKGFFVFEEWWI